MGVTNLDAVVTVGKVVHGFELFVDDTDASLVGSDGYLLDVFGRFAHLGECAVDGLRGLNGGLGVEFS